MTVPNISSDTSPKPGLKCPGCNVNLVMTERQNIEIDYCPECRGIWLDRGELDKIIERSFQPQTPAAQEDNRGNRGSGHGGGGRRGSWLQDIFH